MDIPQNVGPNGKTMHDPVSNTLQSTWAMPCHAADTNLGGAEGFAQDERD